MIVSLPAFTSQHLALGNKDHMLTMNDNRGAQIFAVLRMPGLLQPRSGLSGTNAKVLHALESKSYIACRCTRTWTFKRMTYDELVVNTSNLRKRPAPVDISQEREIYA